jgi:glycosyltransferase involved in cell wall biosynthesis
MSGRTVSVIVAFRNEEQRLANQLAALAAQRCAVERETILVDNGSGDASTAIAQRFADSHDHVRVVREDRQGINHARNAGASAAAGDLLLFCDADDRVDPRWVDAFASSAADWDLAGGRLVGPDDRTRTGPADREATGWALPVALGFLPYATGANLAVKRSVWERLGGFDGTYRRGGTEIEFCWRAQLAGFTLGAVPNAVVHYLPRSSLAGVARQAFAYGTGDARLQRHFHLPPQRLVQRRLPRRTPLSTRTLVRYSAHALGIAYATLDRR